MKVCNVFELNKPSNEQIETICNNIMPTITKNLKIKLIHYIQGDLRKLHNIYNIYCKNNNLLNEYVVDNILKLKSYNQDTKSITNNLFNRNYLMKDHLHVMNELTSKPSKSEIIIVLFSKRTIYIIYYNKFIIKK
jgi:hypothetical protein